MNYRLLIKQKLPTVERILRKLPFLMRLALKLESVLLRQKLRWQMRKSRSNTLDVSIASLSLLPQAKQHGLFDLDWYSQVQNRQFIDEKSAFADYLYKSKFSAVSPGPAFDNLTYLKHNLDVYHADISPLEHYLSVGHREHRAIRPFQPKWHPADSLKTKTDIDSIKHQKVALCFHIFYEDFIEYYANALQGFPLKVDLLLTVSDIKYESLINSKLGGLKEVNQIHIKEVPNRGRNFGPMLVEYADQLQQYDLFCHMHSKKSLYSGRAQTQWADYLGEFLLKDHNVIVKMLNYMNDNQNCGVYYPTYFPVTPDWVNHWLKNKPFRNKYYDDWQLEDKDDFLCYPVGGMFWAKPEALKQMLETKYQYEDFPPEPLANDGSELHALERCIGLLAEKNGYKQLFYYPELGAFTHDKSHIFANYVCNKNELSDKLKPFDIVSFDVFDTLVRRSHYVPDYAKLKLAKQLEMEGVISDAKAFVEQRNDAEFQVRKSKNFQDDVDIFEAYQMLAEILGWDKEKAKYYAELEFAYDLDMIQGKEEIVDLINSFIISGKLVYIVSDTYYTEFQIIMMLRKAGVTNGYKLFVSSKLGLRKDNTTMWAHIKRILPNGKSFVHVGDNAVADAQIPGDFGLQNLHILNPIDKWQAAGWANPFQGKEKLDEQLILKWGPLVNDFGRYPFLGE